MNAFVAPPDFSKSFEIDKEIDNDDFLYFQDVLLSLAGISLSEKKRDLLRTRLSPYIRDNNFKDYNTYRKHLERLPAGHAEWQQLINLITTNKTDFFREMAHFDFIETHLIPYWQESGKKEIHVWSAACSSGEEPYTLAMFLEKKLPTGMTYKIFASDIDTDILNKAKNAVYPMVKEPEIPTEYKKHCIDYGKEGVKEWFRVKKHLKDHITFQIHNLIEEDHPLDKKFDLILCRNVMIYFPKDVVAQVGEKLHDATVSGGHLFIGHSESLQGCNTSWIPTAPSIYRKKL